MRLRNIFAIFKTRNLISVLVTSAAGLARIVSIVSMATWFSNNSAARSCSANKPTASISSRLGMGPSRFAFQCLMYDPRPSLSSCTMASPRRVAPGNSFSTPDPKHRIYGILFAPKNVTVVLLFSRPGSASPLP